MLPYRQSMEPDLWPRLLETEVISQVSSLKAM
jgi:hypothetical protein